MATYDNAPTSQSGVFDTTTNSVATPTPGAAGYTAPTFAGADPNQDPSYLSFLRGAGMNEAQIRAQVAKQKSNLQATLESQRPVWAQTLQQGLGRVLNNAAGRGTARSSNRLTNQALVQQDVGRQQAAYEGNVANQQGTLDENLQERLISIQQQRADQALNAQQSVYNNNLQDYQSNLTNYYLQQILNGAQ